MKIGIFGGTFNPPHQGHLRLAKEVRDALDFDKVIIIPAGVPPHKEQTCPIDPLRRLEMCRLTFNEDFFEISDIEIKREGKSYTIDTLHTLSELYPGSELYLITGSDMLSSFTQWYKYKEILSLCCLVSASREKEFMPNLTPFTEFEKSKIIFLPLPPIEISSSEVRERVREGREFSSLVAEETGDYIIKNRLYFDDKTGYMRLLYEKLDEKRVYHSICVSESAVYLAGKYGGNKEKAAIAGLLHDVMKNATDEEHFKFAPFMTENEKMSRPVWHQLSAPGFLKENSIVTDEEILSAIGCHTTGKGNMTLLEKIIYVADFISKDRDYPDADVVRGLSEKSLDEAIIYCAKYTIDKMLSLNKPIHPWTVECYNSIVSV